MSDSVTDMSTLFYLMEIALAARTIYGFTRTYFTHKLSSDTSMVVERHQHAPRPRLPAATTTAPLQKKKKPVRVYMDGCFDGMHFGHANALRQAKALGDVLVVGINPEVEIRKHKGPPIMSDEERRISVSSVKWVDEVLTDVPYVLTPQFLKKLIEEHNIDIIVHGDDPCVGADGQDVYKAVKEMGRFRTVKRTEGVSSTDIVGRMLLCTRNHHLDVTSASTGTSRLSKKTDGENFAKNEELLKKRTPFTRSSSFLPTTRRLIQFAGEPKAPKPGDRVVYCDGTFDMFHAGHIETLRKAREMGDFLLVGIHDDATVNGRKGSNFPIMNLHERTLAVLSCRHVDEVIIGAPWCITEDMIKTMNISVVVHGSHKGDSKRVDEAKSDPYEIPRKCGLLVQVESESDLTVETILERIVKNREAFVKRNIKKEAAEDEYLTKHKKYIEER